MEVELSKPLISNTQQIPPDECLYGRDPSKLSFRNAVDLILYKEADAEIYHEYVQTKPDMKVKQLKFNSKLNCLGISYQNGGLELVKLNEENQFEDPFLFNEEVDLQFDLGMNHDQLSYLASIDDENVEFGKININSYEVILQQQRKRQKTEGLFMSNDQSRTYYFENNAVRVLEDGDKQLSNFYKQHHITCIANDSGDKYLYYGNKRGHVLRSNLLQKEEDSMFLSHSTPITALSSMDSQCLLASGSQDGQIRIHRSDNLLCVGVINHFKKPVQDLYITQDGEYLLGCDGSEFNIWELYNMNLISKLADVQDFVVTRNEQRIWFAHSDRIVCMQNPLKAETFTVFGPGNKAKEYVDYLRKLIRNELWDYDSQFNDYVIYPHQFSTLHFYAEFNRFQNIEEILANNALYLESKEGITPLTISIFNQDINSTSKFINYILKISKSNPRMGGVLEYDLTNLNRILNVNKIQRIYDELFTMTDCSNIIQFCKAGTQLPITREHNEFKDVNPHYFLESTSEGINQPILFKTFMIPVPIESGSVSSIEFLESLSYHEKFYQLKFIQDFLEWKWSQVRWWMISQAIIYAAYLLVLLIHIGFGFEPISMIINLVIANYLFLIEPLTMITSRSRYFKDWKNYNDLIRSVLFDAYAVFYFIDISDNIEDILLVVVLILSFSRGLVYFAIFSNTRYFVFLVGEVLRDMTTFFIILVYSLLTFTFIFYALDTHQGDNQDFYIYMEQSFKLSRGAFAPANFTPFEKLIYYIGTLICSMILMTILISVVAGTFARVRLNANQTKAMQLADLILEVENVLFWKRDLHKTGYITICLADWDSDKEKSTDDRVKAIESKVEVLASDVANLQQLKSQQEVIISQLQKLLDSQ